MSTDKRELILERLLAIVQSTPGVNLAARNKIEPTDTQLPAIIILDGDEEADDRDPEIRPAMSPRRVMLHPEIEIMLGDLPENVGTTLSGFRQFLIPAITTDATLISLVLDRFPIRYLGCATDLAYGRKMEGTMILRFSFTYGLRPSDLQ